MSSDAAGVPRPRRPSGGARTRRCGRPPRPGQAVEDERVDAGSRGYRARPRPRRSPDEAERRRGRSGRTRTTGHGHRAGASSRAPVVTGAAQTGRGPRQASSACSRAMMPRRRPCGRFGVGGRAPQYRVTARGACRDRRGRTGARRRTGPTARASRRRCRRGNDRGRAATGHVLDPPGTDSAPSKNPPASTWKYGPRR